MATVGDVLREVLPSGTVCLAGKVALSRQTISAVVLRLRGGFAGLAPGAVALINLEMLGQLPARPSLSQAIDALRASRGCRDRSAGRVESTELPIAGPRAQRWSCVLLQLPDSKEGPVSVVEASDYLSDERARCRTGRNGRRARGGR